MANKEKIDYLLIDIRELEKLVAGMRDAEMYPASFFGETFQLAHKILGNLHSLERHQIETLREQMEEHQRLIDSIPVHKPASMPEISVPVVSVVPPEELVRAEQQGIVEKPVIKDEPVIIEPSVKEELVRIPQPETSHKAILSDKQGISLNEILEKKNLSDFRKAFSLNDRFRFRRELFGGDEEKMNKAVSELNDIHTYEESVAYLNNVLKWNIEDPSVADFIKLLEKRFL